MKIAILDDTLDTVRTLPSFARLAGADVTVWNDHTKDVDVLARRLRDTEVLVLIRERTPIPAALVERLPRLRLISQLSVYPHIDVAACTRAGVVVSSSLQPGAPRFDALHATAELTWALTLMAMRRLPEQMSALRAGRWQTAIGRSVRGGVLGIYGFGRIGGVVAGYGRAFGMSVRVWASDASRARAVEAGYAAAPSREAFFAESDVVSLHLRLVPATRGIVTAADLAAMKPTALIVNTSRAGLIAPGALVAALDAGRPGMAALDVFDEEPVTDPRHPLVVRPDVVATPHLGYVERQALEAQFSEIYDQIFAWAAGRPINVVNPEVLAR